MSYYQYRKSHVEIRRSYDRLISTMGFPILVRRHLYIESRPWSLYFFLIYSLYSSSVRSCDVLSYSAMLAQAYEGNKPSLGSTFPWGCQHWLQHRPGRHSTDGSYFMVKITGILLRFLLPLSIDMVLNISNWGSFNSLRPSDAYMRQ